MSTTTNEKLSQFLENGETIRWIGASQPYSLFDPSRKISTYITITIALIWTIISIGGYYASGNEIKTGMVIFFLGITAIILFMPLSDKSKIKKLLYAITDKKLIVTSKEGNDTAIQLPIDAIDDFRIDTGDNGNCHVRVGTSVFKAAVRKLPVLAYRGEFDDKDGTKVHKGVVLFNVSAEDGKTIGKLLKK